MENIRIQDLQDLIEEKIADAKTLFDAGRYSGAVYIYRFQLNLTQ
jgi:hypothetical protein